MIQVPPSDAPAAAGECLTRMSEPGSVLHRAADVLERIAHNGVGLGEVLQDYAAQGHGQIRDLIRAAGNVAQGNEGPDDREVLENAHFILKSVKSVLEMTPDAMQRNKAETLGEKEKLSRADIARTTEAFLHSPYIARLLATECSGALPAPQADTDAGDILISPKRESLHAVTGH